LIRRVVISGCSGGGKSTLVAALAARGFQTFAEPGRDIVSDEAARGGTALPWIDPAAFAARILALAATRHAQAREDPAFYDRSTEDALAWFARTGTPLPPDAPTGLRYHPRVFLAPPWPALFTPDDARRHDLAAALAEYEALAAWYPARGYAVTLLPRLPVAARADWLLARLAG
jgi:predicted ATPase